MRVIILALVCFLLTVGIAQAEDPPVGPNPVDPREEQRACKHGYILRLWSEGKDIHLIFDCLDDEVLEKQS